MTTDLNRAISEAIEPFEGLPTEPVNRQYSSPLKAWTWTYTGIAWQWHRDWSLDANWPTLLRLMPMAQIETRRVGLWACLPDLRDRMHFGIGADPGTAVIAAFLKWMVTEEGRKILEERRKAGELAAKAALGLTIFKKPDVAGEI